MEMSYCSANTEKKFGFSNFRLYLIKKNRQQKKANTAISINVVGLNLQTYKSRPNGAMGIYCNLHITIEEIYKFVFLHVEYFVFLSVKPFLYLFFRRYVVWIILFK